MGRHGSGERNRRAGGRSEGPPRFRRRPQTRAEPGELLVVCGASDAPYPTRRERI
jgi:hypothetical protein